jgi:hypothetical protein
MIVFTVNLSYVAVDETGIFIFFSIICYLKDSSIFIDLNVKLRLDRFIIL